MKLNLNKILARTHILYKNLKLEKGYSQEEVDKMTIRSDQIISLAHALVEAINKEFESCAPAKLREGDSFPNARLYYH